MKKIGPDKKKTLIHELGTEKSDSKILKEKLNQITKIRVVFKLSCENSETRKRKASSETSDLTRRKF